MMRRYLLALAYGLGLVGFLFVAAEAYLPATHGGLGAPAGGVTCTYTGPGDAVTGAKYWAGLRAYSAATCGTPVANVCNSTGGTDQACADLSSSTTTGDLVAGTIGGITCPGANCTVKTLYDQSGANQCGGSPCNATQATVANRPTLDANCLNTSKPCMNWPGTAAARLVAGSLTTISAPLTMTAVAQRNSAFTSWQGILESNGGNDAGLLFLNVAATVVVQSSTTTLARAATDSALHSILGVTASGTGNTIIAVDNAETTGTLSTGVLDLDVDLNLGGDSFSQPLRGYLAEAGVWSGTLSSGNRTAVCHNQFGYWATAASC